ATNLCALDELELGDEENCNDDSLYGSGNSCDIKLVCSRPVTVDFAGGVDAKLVDSTTASCYRESNSLPFECSCGALTVKEYYGVVADTGPEACSALARYCHEAPDQNPGPEMCAQKSVDAGADSCDLDEICWSPLTTYNEVDIAELNSRGAHCTRSSATTSSCYCSGTGSMFHYEIGLEPLASSCETTSSYCSKEAVFEATGEASCAPTSQTAGVEWCEADLDCTQPATANGDPLVAG